MGRPAPVIKEPPKTFKYELGKTSFDELAKLTTGQLLWLCWDTKILPRGHVGGEWTKSEIATALSTGQVLWKLANEVEERSSETLGSVTTPPDAVAPRVRKTARPDVKVFVKESGSMLADYEGKFPLLTNVAEDAASRLSFELDALGIIALFVKVLQDCPNALNAASAYAAMKHQPSFAYRRARIVLHREAFQLFTELPRQHVNELVAKINDVAREYPRTGEEIVELLAPELKLLGIVPRS